MAKQRLAAVVLAAGKGKRMRSSRPKALHALAGRPLIGHVLASLATLRPERSVVVIGPGMGELARAVAPIPCAIQRIPLGTGHATAQAARALAGFAGTILVLYADTPLIEVATLSRMLARRAAPDRPSVVVLGFRPADPTGYGRLIEETGGPPGALARIVEETDATDDERAIGLCNSGVMAVDAAHLFRLLRQVGRDNAKGEQYLTDIVALARAEGLGCAIEEGAAEELLGINSRAELARAEAAMQGRLRERAMEAGATLVDPATTYLSWDTRLGPDTVVGPCNFFGPGVVVEAGAEIRPFCHIEGARVGAGAVIGPFARLRPGARIGAGAHIGNFVEVKQARIGKGAKANHLTYIGDASVGEAANIGAGTITCNYDGFAKHLTRIGARSFIGSNTALVAPVKVGAGAVVGAGSVIVRNVGADSIAVARGEQTERKGAARALRRRYKARAAKRKG